MDSQKEICFPPQLSFGARVWTFSGYCNHGPENGPKVNIKANQGGTIDSTIKPNLTIDSLLYVVRWDNGQMSKHYANGLFCIDSFSAFDDFLGSITLQGPIELTIGPQDGFRQVKTTLFYDGRRLDVEIDKYNREYWDHCIDPLARRDCVEIKTVRLPVKQRSKQALPPRIEKLLNPRGKCR